MKKYEEARIKLTNTQINKSKSSAKRTTGTTLTVKTKTFKMKNCLMN